VLFVLISMACELLLKPSRKGVITYPPPHRIFPRYKKITIRCNVSFPAHLDMNHIGQYEHVKEICFTGCYLPTIIFHKNLMVLKFYSCNFKNLEFIHNLPNLTDFTISNVTHTRKYELSPLIGTKIRNLELSFLDVEDLSFLENNSCIQSLDLSGNKLKDISILKTLTNLQKLNISENFIEDVSPLAILQKLRYLDISANSITHISDLVDNNESLQRFYCRINKIQDVSCFFRNWSISHVSIFRNPITEQVREAVLDQCSLNHLNEHNRKCTLFEKLTHVLHNMEGYVSWWSYSIYHTEECKGYAHLGYMCENDPSKLDLKYQEESAFDSVNLI